jgi:hypothetical protein
MPLPKGEVSTLATLDIAKSSTDKTTAANSSDHKPDIENPGVKNAVISRIIADTTIRLINPPKPSLSVLSIKSSLFHK